MPALYQPCRTGDDDVSAPGDKFDPVIYRTIMTSETGPTRGGVANPAGARGEPLGHTCRMMEVSWRW